MANINLKVSWCPICSSVELRNLIISKIENNGLSLFLICQELEISYQVLKKHWFKATNPGAAKGCRAREIKKIAEIVNVNIKIIVSDGMIDIDKIKPFLKLKQGRRYVTIDNR